jgi:hypothetical protein
LAIIDNYTPEVEQLKRTFNYKDEDFVMWRQEEMECLCNLAREPEYDVLATSYVEALEALQHAE